MRSRKFPLLPIKDTVVFPFTNITFKVGRDFSIKAIEEALLNENREIVLITQKNPEIDSPDHRDLFDVGTLCSVIQVVEGPEKIYHVFIEGSKRIRFKDLSWNKKGFYEVDTSSFRTTGKKDKNTKSMRKVLEKNLSTYLQSMEVPEDIVLDAFRIDNDEKFLDVAASFFQATDPLDMQTVLEESNLPERYRKMATVLKMEVEFRELESNIESSVREKFEKGQKEFFINEHINALKGELSGENNGGQSYEEELLQKIDTLDAPEAVKEKLYEEYNRYEMLPPMSAESGVISTYLETMVKLPWNVSGKTQINIDKAAGILDREHFGLKEVKTRILEYLAVLKLKGDLKSPIICLVGPPGVGKTSIAASIAKATERKYVRQSLGGIKDEAEIRGHRRTYIGALPGKIIQSLKKIQVKNPLFLLDEIDKLANDFRGDPASALLEVLDPEQNSTFIDHYVDMEFDLSDILFVATANDVSMIPPALRDRMEVIEINGYTWYEKKKIAEKFLIPKQKEINGIEDIVLTFSKTGMMLLIDGYTSESGVRDLERKISKICRSVSLKKVSQGIKKKKVSITGKNIEEFLGPEKYNEKQKVNTREVGVVNGLAWTPFGGVVLKIEAIKYPGQESIKITGSLGDVMRESVEIAVSYVRSIADRLFRYDREQWEKNSLHIHFPEGATPKDGPSAGMAIALAVASLMSGRPVEPYVGMTGELTLRGNVLKIGGLRAKIMAAKKAGIKKIYIPHDNISDFNELPHEIKGDLDVFPVKSATKVLEECLAVTGKNVKYQRVRKAGASRQQII
jgi:ATP-dependent Lon protease